MCGITLIFNKNYKYLSKNYIKPFTNMLRHRGPDGFGYYNDNELNLSIGHSRLKIIDLSNRANQPMLDNNKRFILTFNGEIYNHLEIRDELQSKGYIFKTKSDTEVILYSYIEWGKNCLFRFNGIWAFVIYDSFKKELFISRDRFGVKPLYYYHDNNNFFISSELKAFKAIKDKISLSINHQKLSKLKDTEITRETIINNVKQLYPGENAFYDFKSIYTYKWWDTYENLPTDIKKKDYIDYFNQVFAKSCKLRMTSDVPITTALSGGLDSSSVVAELNQDFSNFKKHVSFFLNYNFQESEKKYVEALKDKYGLEIKQFDLLKEDFNYHNLLNSTLAQEAIGDDALGPWIIYMNMNKEGYKVSIDGHGPDELIGGYNNYRYKYKSLYFKIKTNWRHLKQKVLFNEPNYFKFNKEKNLYKIKSNFIIPNGIKGLNRLFYHDFHYGTLPAILNKFDKISMSHSVESREPFLDFNLVTFLFSLPEDYKVNKFESKIILRKSMASKLPNNILQRRDKKGFAFENSQFYDHFHDLIKSIAFSKKFKEDDFFDYKKIKTDIESNQMNYKKLFRYIQVFFLKNYLI